jgi:aspartate/methionine/tyrosine aminotransferase
MIKASERCATRPASGIRAMGYMAAAYENVLYLTAGEPDFSLDKPIAEAMKKAIDEGKTKYTATAGIPELCSVVADKLKRENGIDCDAKSILIANGATEAIMVAIWAATDVGDEILLPDPGWPNYVGQVHMAGCQAAYYPLLEKDKFHARAEQIEKKITPRTRMLFLNSPSNPTGGVTSREELVEIAELVKRHNLAVVSDEPYEKLLYDGARHVSIGSLPGMQDYVFTANTLSKTYAMTGIRVGYLQGPPQVMSTAIKLMESMSTCVNGPAQWAAIEALNGSQDYVQEMVEQYARRRKILLEGLNALPGVSCLAPEGAFYAFPNITKLGKSSYDVAVDWLQRAQVNTVPGHFFGAAGEGFVRICFAVSEDTIREALARLARILEKTPVR